MLCLYDDYMFDVLLVMSSLEVFPMFMKKEDLLFFDNDRCNLKGKFIELKVSNFFPKDLNSNQKCSIDIWITFSTFPEYQKLH